MNKLCIVACLLLVLSTSHCVSAWKMERPSFSANIFDRAENSTTYGMVSAGLGISIDRYTETPGDQGLDYFQVNASLNSNARTGITYAVDYYFPYTWLNIEYPINTGISGDDCGAWINITGPQETMPIRFYGGLTSAQYDRVWVCTNGFISFEHNSTDSYPSSWQMPNVEKPNTVIAALWTDLLVDAQSSITCGYYGIDCFVISYNYVLDKGNDQRQTFQIVLQSAFSQNKFAYEQSRIWITYQSVNASFFAYGIEDQEGLKGNAGFGFGVYTGRTFEYFQNSNYALLRCLTINFNESDDCAGIWMSDDSLNVKGVHLLHTVPSPPDDPTFSLLLALSGSAVFLLGHSGVIALMMIGETLAYVLIPFNVVNLVTLFARTFRSNVDVMDAADSYGHWGKPPLQNGAYLKVLIEDNTVDASVGVSIYWIFSDANNQNHALSISATAQYDEYETDGTFVASKNVTTTVNLDSPQDAGNSTDNSRLITAGSYRAWVGIGIYPPTGTDDVKDFYKVWVPDGKAIEIWMWPPDSSTINFDLHLYRPNGVLQVSATHGPDVPEHITWTDTYEEYWFIEVNATSGQGLYNLTVSLFDKPPPGGSCPTLFVWNGSDYTYEALLNIHADSDITLRHTVEQTLVKDGFFYKLSLRELDQFTSHIDQVKLYAVDEDGVERTCILTQALHSRLGTITLQLWFDDNIRIDMQPTDTIDLKFILFTNKNIQYFIFEINGYNPKDVY